MMSQLWRQRGKWRAVSRYIASWVYRFLTGLGGQRWGCDDSIWRRRKCIADSLLRRKLRRCLFCSGSLLWSQLPLILLLLRSAQDRRLFTEDLLQVFQELGDVGPIPHAYPISKIRMVHFAVDADMLSRLYDHVLPWGDIDHGGLVGIGVRNPYSYRKVICGPAKGSRKCACKVQE